MPDFTDDIWNEIFVIGWLLTAGGGLGATMRWSKTRVYGQKTATRAEAFFFRQSDNFILLSITRSPAQGSACKDLERDGQGRAITPEAAYTPIPNRAGSRSHKKANESVCCD
ncbi:ATP-dependent nuclease subunit B [Lacticaseibacillus rhamnosus]|nr:ATP-dependent nuclease subunit B [Lacticaseibacillus rhamnosus]MCT3181999.1 ATP-dependent nuclease subunit B [Lacticaseibacillus rhamnosus]